MKSKKTKIKYGKVTLGPEFLDPKNHKVRITTFIPGDVLQWLRSEADKMGIGYQTFLAIKLKELKDGSTDEHIRAIVRDELKRKGA
jgi:hypothetical protein